MSLTNLQRFNSEYDGHNIGCWYCQWYHILDARTNQGSSDKKTKKQSLNVKGLFHHSTNLDRLSHFGLYNLLSPQHVLVKHYCRTLLHVWTLHTDTQNGLQTDESRTILKESIWKSLESCVMQQDNDPNQQRKSRENSSRKTQVSHSGVTKSVPRVSFEQCPGLIHCSN